MGVDVNDATTGPLPADPDPDVQPLVVDTTEPALNEQPTEPTDDVNVVDEPALNEWGDPVPARATFTDTIERNV